MVSTGKGSRELFICGICTEPYDDNQHKPKFLTCHHTFCFHCLNQWHKKKGRANTRSIPCPNCNQPSNVPKNGIAGLQTNFYIERMKENLKEEQEPKCDDKMEGCQKHVNHPTFFFCMFLAVCITIYICTVLHHMKSAGHFKSRIQETAHSTLADQLLRSHAIQKEIQNAIQEIEPEMQTLQDNAGSAKDNLVTLIQLAQQELQQCLQEASDAISQHHAIQHGKLMDKQWLLQQAAESLEKYISQSEVIIQTGDINEIITYKGSLEKHTRITKFHLDQRETLIESELVSGPNLLNGRFDSIGQTYCKSIMPTSVAFMNDEITAGLESVIKVELFNDAGNKFLSFPSFLTVKIIDPQQDKLPITLNTTPDYTMTFTPQVSGKHEISVMCLGQKLKSEQTHIMVNSNNPVLKFGSEGCGDGMFTYPFIITRDNKGVLYVADESNRGIQKFSDNGEFLNKYFVTYQNEKQYVLSMALDQVNDLIHCTTHGDNFRQRKKGILVFDLNGQPQHSYNFNVIVYPESIAINRHHEIIISDPYKRNLCKFNTQTKYLNCMGNLVYPGPIAISNDDSIIVADILDHTVYVYSPDGSVMHKFGSFGNEKGQLRSPYGVATDGEYILVGEIDNHRIQVFRQDGTFVSMIESKDDPLQNPGGLVVTGDGYVYVADTNNNCIKKYKYRHMP